MSNENLEDMLSATDKGAEKATGALARLFRELLKDIGMTPMAWSSKMERFLDDPRNRIPRNGKDRSSARGNMNKELCRPTMTWKVFRKGLQFLGAVHVRFEIHATWPNRTKTVTGINIQLAPSNHARDKTVVKDSEDEE